MRRCLSHALAMVSKSLKKDTVRPVDRFLLIDKDRDGKLSHSEEKGFESHKCHMIDLPSLRQSTTSTCGPLAVQLILEYYGIDARERDLAKSMGTGPGGTTVGEMEGYLKKKGFDVEVKEGATIDEVKGLINDGVPAILNLQAWPEAYSKGWEDGWKDGHYVVAVGYTDKHILFSDPSSVYDTYLRYEELDRRWHDTDGKNRLDHYIIIPTGKKPVYRYNRVEHMG